MNNKTSKLITYFIIALLSSAVLYIAIKPLISNLGLCSYLGKFCTLFTKIFYNKFVYSLLIIGFTYGTFRLTYGIYQRNRILKAFTEYKFNHLKLNNIISRLNTTVKFYTGNSVNPVAFSSGIFNKPIYISNNLVDSLTEKELEAIIAHELCHIKNNDVLKITLAGYLSDVLFFIPGLKALYHRLETENEYFADYSSSEKAGKDNVINALLRMVQLNMSQPQITVSFANSKTDVLNRIKKLQGRDVNHKPGLSAVMLTIVPLIVFSSLTISTSVSIAQQKVCPMHTSNVSVSLHCR